MLSKAKHLFVLPDKIDERIKSVTELLEKNFVRFKVF